VCLQPEERNGLLKNSEKQIPRGLNPLGMTKRKHLPARLKSCPDTKAANPEFFSNLLKPAA
jgi:hypothetical protein